MPRKKGAQIETVFDVMEMQDYLLNMLSEKRMEISVNGEVTGDEWRAIREEIGRAAKGFISEDTVELINIMDEHGLYVYPRYLLKLEQKLRRDFNTLRKIYVEKGWIYLPPVGEVTTLERPVRWEEISKERE